MNADDTFRPGSPLQTVEGSANVPAVYETPVKLTPLTGRDIEVSLLRDRWERAQEGMGQVVLIVGEPGLGKSRLVRTIRETVIGEFPHAASHAVVEWRCSQQLQNTGLHPVSDFFERQLSFDPGEPYSKRFDRLAGHLEEHGLGNPEVVALFAKLLFLPPDERYPAPRLPPVRERAETFRILRRWLEAHASRQPFLFVVEDLHWIDASTLEFLDEFIAEGLQDRILTVLTFRPEFETPWPAVAHQTSLALNRLTRGQVAQLMEKDAGRVVPDSLISQIYERTRGLPLLVEEFTRLIRESMEDASSGDEIRQDIPATLQELLLLRLDRMSRYREIAQIAATLGHEFSYDLLAAVAPVGESKLRAELEKLAAADILHVEGRPPLCTYVFKHDLLEEALHGALDENQRCSFHRHVAEVLEARFPQTARSQPELLALHFTEGGLLDKATEYWLKAGLLARDQFANIEAINHLTRGLDLLRTLPETPRRERRELEFLGPLGTACIAAHGYAAPEVEPVFSRARILCERVGTVPQLFAMMRGNFAFHIVRGRFRHCTDLATEMLKLGQRQNDPGLLMESLFLKGLTKLYRGDFRGAHPCLERALADFDDRERTAYWSAFTGEDSGVTVRCYLALACWYLGYVDRAFRVNVEARELARVVGQPFNIGYALHHTGRLYQNGRQGVETQAAGEEEVAIAEEQGFPLWEATGTLFTAAGLLLQKKLEPGLRMFRQGLEAYRATGAALGVPYYLCILAEALMHLKRHEEARQALEEALSLAESYDERFHQAELYRVDGDLRLAESKDEGGAEDCYRKAIDVARRQGSRTWELRATLSLARLWHEQGLRDKAFARLRSIFGEFQEGLNSPDLMDASALLRELGNERMRKDLAAGIKYVRDSIPPPCKGIVSVDWRYVPSSTLGGDTIGYHWLDEDHLALYLIDVTGHGLDSALLSVTINNVIRTGSLPKTDMRKPEQVLARLNEKFPGHQHAQKYFTAWYGVYCVSSGSLTYASGGHPSAIVVKRDDPRALVLPATGPVIGALPNAEFPASSFPIAPGARLLIFSDGAFEIRHEREMTWNLSECIAFLTEVAQRDGNLMDELLERARRLRGSSQLDDDFSVIEARISTKPQPGERPGY